MSAIAQMEGSPKVAAAQRVAWLPAHPAEGWVSMNRYWLSLAQAAQMRADVLRIETPIETADLVSPRRGRVARAWNRYVAYPARVRSRVSAPVAHILDHSYSHLLGALRRGTRSVVTVHDLIPLVDPAGLNASQVERFRKVALRMRDADRLVAVSEFTKRSIVELLGIEPGRVTVVHSGVDAMFCGQGAGLPPRVKGLPKGRYVFSVGSAIPRKNLGVLPGVLHELAARVPDAWLVRAGAPMSEALASACQAALRGGMVIDLGSVTDAELCALYQNAGALFVPSTFEGWGLPVAEALAAGCPVVCSNVSSLPEAGADAALMAAPDDETGFAIHLAHAIDNPSQRAAMIARGREVSRERTWSRHLDALADIYRSLTP